MQILLDNIVYVIGSQYFWGSMGFTTAIAMFVGALIYDGTLNDLKKGLATLLSYVALIIFTDLSRIIPRLETISPGHNSWIFGGVVTLVLITLFYATGLGLGVFLFSRAKRLKRLVPRLP